MGIDEGLIASLSRLQGQLGEQLVAVSHAKMRKGLTKAAQIVERYAKTHMSPHGPSAPGEFPAVDTGRLRASITHQVVEEDGDEVAYVGTNVEYARDLELGTSRVAARPFMVPSLVENSDAIRDAIAGALRDGN